MSQNHHFHLSKRERKGLFEGVINIAAFLYPLTGLPQVIAVFQGSAEGVSVASWIGFTVFAALFLYYGISRHIRPMIIINSLWLVIDVLTVVGILMRQ